MVNKETQCMQPDTKHRVRFFETHLHFEDAVNMDTNEIFWTAADIFKKTDKYQWVESNGIVLQWSNDLGILAWHRQIVFYGDLTERQFIDYTLRFV